MKIILASHGKLAKGMKDTVEMIAGKQPNLEAYEAYGEGESDDKFITEIRDSISKTADQVIVVTDVLGGSVNNEMTQFLKDYSNLQLIAGMNFPLIITLVTSASETLTEKEISAAIEEAKKGVVSVNKLILASEQDEEDEL